MNVPTTCNRDCPDACGIVATVEDGRVVKLRGDPEHPVTRGFLCYRTSRFLERQYDPARLTSPMLRRADAFRPIGWDEALDLVAEKMLRIKAESGPAAILHYRSGGSLGLMKHVSDYFFERFGPTAVKSGDVCSGAGDEAQTIDFGDEDSNDLFDLANSRCIVLWGKNPHVSNLHLIPLLKEARARGAAIVLIDPIRHRGAELADLYVQPRPGGDMALGLGVGRRLFETGRTDPAAPSYCDNFAAFRALCFTRTIDGWASLSGVRPDEIEAIADLYAAGPSNIQVGWGMQRRTRGAATVRVLDAIGAVSGNLGIPGGGVSFYFKRRGAFDTSFVGGKDAAPRALSEPLLGREILEAADPAVRMVWITAGNPVAMLPESGVVAKALATRELTVVVDSFINDTARAAHLVLPTTTMLEDDDLVGAYGHHWLGEVRPVVPPPEGVKTDYEILQALAKRVGLADAFAPSVEDWKRALLGKVAPKGASLDELRKGPVRNPLAAKVFMAGRSFATASGKVNLIHQADPAPPQAPTDRPLFLMAVSTEKAQSSQWLPRWANGPCEATVHPDAAPGFANGDLAVVESEIASMTVRLAFDPLQRRDLVVVPKGGSLAGGRCANALVRAEETDLGQGAVYYDTPVRIVAPSREQP